MRPPILKSGLEDMEAPASFAQQRLWFIDQLGGGSVEYNMPGALRLEGRFDEAIAEQALQCIVERHKALRTVFRNGPEGVTQQIRTKADFRGNVWI